MTTRRAAVESAIATPSPRPPVVATCLRPAFSFRAMSDDVFLDILWPAPPTLARQTLRPTRLPSPRIPIRSLARAAVSREVALNDASRLRVQ